MFYNNGTLFILSGSLRLSSLWLVRHRCRGATLYASRLSSRLPSPASVEGLLLVVFFFFFLCYFLKASSPPFVVFICDVHQY